MESIQDSDGDSHVIIYLEQEKAIKKLPPNYDVQIDLPLLERLKDNLVKKMSK